MASNTPNLGLLKKDPVADGNETFNIQTMLNDNWDKIDEAVGNIKVPDASLTEKGIVQLSNATDGTREDVAATEKAVKAAYDRGSAGVTAAAAAQAKAEKSLVDAKSYSDANFYKNYAFDWTTNLVPNCTALMGLQYWNPNVLDTWSYSGLSADVTGFFYPSKPFNSGTTYWMDSQLLGVAPGGTYYLSCTFHTNGDTRSGAVRVEVINANNTGVIVGILYADPNKWWHRKSLTVTIPSNVTSVYIRLVVDGPVTDPTTVIRGFSRIKFSAGTSNAPLSFESDIKALFQYANDGKSKIASAINGKGVSASGSDDFATLAAKIGLIRTGVRKLLANVGQTVRSTTTSTFDMITGIRRGMYCMYRSEHDTTSLFYSSVQNGYEGSPGAGSAASTELRIYDEVTGTLLTSMISANQSSYGANSAKLSFFEVDHDACRYRVGESWISYPQSNNPIKLVIYQQVVNPINNSGVYSQFALDGLLYIS